MIKLLILAGLASIILRWALGKWPWDYLRNPPTRSQRLDDARRVLGLDAAATRTEIREAHRRIAADIHPDRGGDNARLAELNAARDTLLAGHPDKESDHR
jgi:hypothetical protein